MANLKKCWVTLFATCDDLAVLSLESERVDEVGRLHPDQRTFPDRETGETRHVVTLSLLDDTDLLKIYEAIGRYLGGRYL